MKPTMTGTPTPEPGADYTPAPDSLIPEAPATEASARSRVKRIALWAVGLLLFAALIASSGLDDLPRLSSLGLGWLAASLVLVLFSHFLFAVRWTGLVNALEGDHILTTANGYYYALSATAAGFVAVRTASNLIVRAVLLRQTTALTMARSLLSVLVDKLADLALIALYAPAVIVYLAAPGAEAVVWALLAAGTVLYFLPVYAPQAAWRRLIQGLLGAAVAVLTRLPLVRRIKLVEQLRTVHATNVWHSLPRQQMLVALALTVAGELALVGRAWFLALALGIDAPLLVFVIGVVLGQLSLFLAFTPGAIGVLEGSWFIVLQASDFSGDAISTFLISQRALQMLILSAIWLVVHLLKTATRPTPA